MANYYSGTVSKFAPGATTPSATLTGLTGPDALAFDGSGNLYVANYGNGTVSKFAPGATTPSATLTGLWNPDALAFDSSGNLYVANYSSSGGTVSKFAPGATTPSATLSGLHGPDALAVDSSGNLYVGNYAHGYTVSMFAPGCTTPSATFTGVDSTTALAFDGSGNLYAANSGNNTVSKFGTARTVIPTAPIIYIRPSMPALPMSLGGSNTAVAGVNLTDAELAQILIGPASLNNNSPGEVVIGSGGSLTGNITFTTATVASTVGALTYVMQYASGPGQIILDDGAGTGTALNGNGGRIILDAGTGGIVAASANNATAEIATTGTTVNLNTTGPIGTSSNRIQFADNANTALQKIIIGQWGSVNEPSSSVYLDGLGSLTLSSLQGRTANTLIDVTARTNLTVLASTTVDSGTSTLRLGADLKADGTGDDGTGTLSIGPYATITSTNTTAGAIMLRGADIDIDTSANMAAVGGQRPVPSTTFTGLSQILTASQIAALALDGSGNLYAISNGNNTVCKFAPGATTPSATLTGLSNPLALALDGSSNLYVANMGNNTVSKFAPGATTPSTTLTGLSGPDALAFDSSGNLYVANHNNNTVSKFAAGGHHAQRHPHRPEYSRRAGV